MILQEYIATNQSKYAVIGAAAYDADPVAQSVSTSPRRFIVEAVEYVILSLDPDSIAGLVGYIESTGTSVEYTFNVGTGLVSLLTHTQALELLALEESTEPEEGV